MFAPPPRLARIYLLQRVAGAGTLRASVLGRGNRICDVAGVGACFEWL